MGFTRFKRDISMRNFYTTRINAARSKILCRERDIIFNYAVRKVFISKDNDINNLRHANKCQRNLLLLHCNLNYILYFQKSANRFIYSTDFKFNFLPL